MWNDLKTAASLVLLGAFGVVGLEVIVASRSHRAGLAVGMAIVLVDAWFWTRFAAERRRTRITTAPDGYVGGAAASSPKRVAILVAVLLGLVLLVLPTAFIALLDRW